jgi:hypothetical protein
MLGGPDCTYESWQGDEGIGNVAFGPSGRVEAAKFWPGGRVEVGPLDRLLWRLERRIKSLGRWRRANPARVDGELVGGRPAR